MRPENPGYRSFTLARATTTSRMDTIHARATTWDPDPLTPDTVPTNVFASFARGGRNLQAIRTD